ncbi:MAG: hypothetical protein BJ554DRAFT_7040, partial [Olpidium bornovanus]
MTFAFQTVLTDEEQSFRQTGPAEHGVTECADAGEGAQGTELETVEESVVGECGEEEAGEDERKEAGEVEGEEPGEVEGEEQAGDVEEEQDAGEVELEGAEDFDGEGAGDVEREGAGDVEGEEVADVEGERAGDVEVEKAVQDEETVGNGGGNRTTEVGPEEVDQGVPANSVSGASNDDEATVPTRRSGRTRVKPLEWWKNEKKKLLDHGQKVEVIKAAADDSSKDVFIKKPAAKKSSSSKPKARESRKSSSRRANSPDRDVAEEVPKGLGYDMSSGQEKSQAVAVSADLIRPRLVNNQSFQFQKTFSEGNFM